MSLIPDPLNFFTGALDVSALRDLLNQVIRQFNVFSGWIIGENDTGGVITVSGNYTVGLLDRIIEANATGGNIVITVPLSRFPGKDVQIVKTDATANTVTVKDDSLNTIATLSTGPTNGTYNTVFVWSDGQKVLGSVGNPVGVSSGTVNAGTGGNLAYYAANGTTISGNLSANMSGGALTLGQAGSVQGSVKLAGLTSGTTTLAAPATGTGTMTFQAGNDTVVGRATTDTLTNKSLDGGSNTLTNIANASLTNSSVTIAGNAVSLGGSIATATLRSSLELGLVSKTANYTVADTDGIIECDATGGGFTVIVPRSRPSGRIVRVVKVDATANIVTITDDVPNTLGAMVFAPQGGVFDAYSAYSNGTAVRLV